jgi:cyclase
MKSIYDMFYGADSFTFQKAEELRKVMTPSEKLLWERLKNKQFLNLKFRRQHPINRFITDFYCHQLKLVIELDGSIHNDVDVLENDKRRQSEIEDFGITVLRFQNETVFSNCEAILTDIRRISTEKGI